MVSLRVLLVLSAMAASVNGHTRGSDSLNEEHSHGGLARHKTELRMLMKKSYKERQPLYIDPQDEKKDDDDKDKDKDKKKNEKKNKEKASDGVDQGPKFVAEDTDCIPFNDEMHARASLSLSDYACRDNQCGGGCCRIYHWLICDENDEMPQLACVCNENTRPIPTPPPVPAPTNPPTTPAPTESTVSNDIKDGDNGVTKPPVAATAQTKPPVVDTTPVATKPPFIGGAPADDCVSGSPHHNNPLFRDFTKCFSSGDCPLAKECCIHSFCFCGEPDEWTGDCVARPSDTSK